MLVERFWSKVDKNGPNGCWVWMANRNNKGYGLFRPGGTAPKRLSHRLAYEAIHGRIPKGAIILHSCDNPACVNPDHLRPGTHKDNVADMDKRGRRVTSPMRGEDNPYSKMTDEKVIGIRTDYINGLPLDAICRRYGCSDNAVGDYLNGRSWKHLFSTGSGPTKDQLALEARRRTRNHAKITQEDADEIRRRLESGETGRSLAVEYGVHFATISDIKTGKTWVS